MSGRSDPYVLRASPNEAERLTGLASSVEDMSVRALDRLPELPLGMIVDLGCGTGSFTKVLGRRFPDRSVIGLDTNEGFLEHAASGNRSANVSFVSGDVTRLPTEDGTVALAFIRFLFQHVPEAPSVVAEMHRVLRPAGLVVSIETDWGGQLLHPEPPLLESAARHWSMSLAANGVDVYIGRKMPGILREAGLTVCDVRIEADVSTYDEPASARTKLSARALMLDQVRDSLPRLSPEATSKLKEQLLVAHTHPQFFFSEYRVVTTARLDDHGVDYE